MKNYLIFAFFLQVAEPVDITHEYYLALLLDRNAGSIVMVGSTEGGMNIEETAAKRPDAIKKVVHVLLVCFSELQGTFRFLFDSEALSLGGSEHNSRLLQGLGRAKNCKMVVMKNLGFRVFMSFIFRISCRGVRRLQCELMRETL